MQKKCLLFVMVFSCAVQSIVVAAEQSNVQEDPYAQLREDLRALRNHPDNAIYANAMIEGIEAIDKAKQEKIKLIEKDRAERKNKVSSNRPWFFGSEAVGTLVYNEDKKIDDELNTYKKGHETLAATYRGYTNFMHNDLSNIAQKNLASKVDSFKNMEKALRECPLGDQECYDQFVVPLYSKMADPNYRRTIQEHHYMVVLKAAHDKNIPITDDELRTIISKNEAYELTKAEIDALDNSIDNLVNPEKIKKREEKKRAQDLEMERIKKEKEEMEVLKEQLSREQDNMTNDSNPISDK